MGLVQLQRSHRVVIQLTTRLAQLLSNETHQRVVLAHDLYTGRGFALAVVKAQQQRATCL